MCWIPWMTWHLSAPSVTFDLSRLSIGSGTRAVYDKPRLCLEINSLLTRGKNSRLIVSHKHWNSVRKRANMLETSLMTVWLLRLRKILHFNQKVSDYSNRCGLECENKITGQKKKKVSVLFSHSPLLCLLSGFRFQGDGVLKMPRRPCAPAQGTPGRAVAPATGQRLLPSMKRPSHHLAARVRLQLHVRLVKSLLSGALKFIDLIFLISDF